jgi:osmoprotectant transport system ATP-binding protein
MLGRFGMAAPAALIAFREVTKIYAGDRLPALDRLTLAVPQGQFLVVAGRSGAGKSTLLRLVNRLTEPSAGAVLVEGEDVRGLDPIGLRRRIGYVFQGVGLFPHMTVAENVGITLRLAGADRAAVAARVDELIRLVELDPARHRQRYPHELSGGERQRVGFARALAASPRIMLMDEPFGALDPATRDTLAGEYLALHERLGLTSLMITHDLVEALLIADRIAVLEAGRLIADDSPQALLRAEDDPAVAALLAAPRRHAGRLAALMAHR